MPIYSHNDTITSLNQNFPGRQGNALAAIHRNSRLSAEVVSAARTLRAEESGAVLYLSSATGFATTLPPPALGLEFTFVIGATPNTSGNHTIVTSGSANIIQGNSFISPDAIGVAADKADSINLVAISTVMGDEVQVHSDGTNWYVKAFASLAAAVTFTKV